MALRASNLGNNTLKGKKTVEQTFTKLSQLEHILLRPDTYIGSAERVQQTTWVWDSETKHMVNKEIVYPPGLYKIFDEILVNAADHKQRDPSMNSLKVEIDPENQLISVWNNGSGIPIEMHKKEKVYVPELIFGNLLTSSNYDDEEKKVVGGRNGFGAKLANIFSTEFTIETADTGSGKRYKQVFRNNMSEKDEAVIRSNPKKESYTKVSFSPDLSRFGMEYLDTDIVSLMKKRVYDIAGVNSSLKVYLNGTKLPIKNFKDYVNLYSAEVTSCPILHERLNDRWEVAVTASDGQLSQVSFVNSIWTIKGGTHVSHIADQIVTKVAEHITKKNKGLKVKPFQIKSHLSLYVNCLIENPSFDSQTKETLTTKPAKFGSKWSFTDELAKKVVSSEIVQNVLAFAKFKQSKELSKTDGGKKARVSGIPKLDDANKAGSRESYKCTLILTEGDSAKALAVSGLSVVGRDYYGVFPLRGKLLNVREAKHKQIMDNAEINNLKKILGLQHNKKYCEETVKSLRYGHVLIMADQDHDGSHIKGLVINFFDHFWPTLLTIDGFLQEFITPIVKCIKGKSDKVFFTMPEYKHWIGGEEGTQNGWRAKYYKGLGTSTAAEAKGYFSNLPRHLHEFHHTGKDDSDMIEMAFSKQRVNDRKDWLSAYTPGTFFDHGVDELNYSNFVNKELILFSVADNSRSIPSVIDGLKPSQRKVLFACFKRKLTKTEIKVAQLAGYVSEHAAYHHGEMSLQSTIVGLAQNFVGSNNANLLVPAGQFGTRLQGGKDAASSRYIFTKLAPISRALFPEVDDALLSYLEEDGLSIEPTWYCPVIPTVLVNGSDGIGTGWSSSVPCYNPRDLIDNIRRLLRGEQLVPVLPWYRGFEGAIVPVENAKSFDVYGKLRKGANNSFKIEELPIRSWTTPYKEFLESSIIGSSDAKAPFVKDFQDNGTENKVLFTITTSAEHASELCTPAAFRRLKLASSISTSNMVLFDGEGRIRKYETPEEIIQEFYSTRHKLYIQRRLHLLSELEKDLLCLDNKQRFILMVIDGKLKVAKRKKVEILADLKRLKFASIPKQKKGTKTISEESDGEESDADVSRNDGGYDYLLSMPIWSLTYERVEHLSAQRDGKAAEKREMESTTPEELWEKDLTALEVALSVDEASARAMAADLERVARAAHNRQNKGKGKRGKAVKSYICEDDDMEDVLEEVAPPTARTIVPKKVRVKKAPAPPKKTKGADTNRKPAKTSLKKQMEEDMLSDEDMSDLCDDSSEEESLPGNSDSEDELMERFADVSLNQESKKDAKVQEDGAVKPGRGRRNVVKKSILDVKPEDDVIDIMESDSEIKSPSPMKVAKKTGRTKAPTRKVAAKKKAVVIESDDSDGEDTMSLSERLANRLKLSKAIEEVTEDVKDSEDVSPKPKTVGGQKQAKTVATKRARVPRTKATTSQRKGAIISPSPSPMAKKTRIKSPQEKKTKGRQSKKNVQPIVRVDSDDEVEEEVVVVSRPRRQRAAAVRRVIIEDSEEESDSEEFKAPSEDDSDFE